MEVWVVSFRMKVTSSSLCHLRIYLISFPQFFYLKVFPIFYLGVFLSDFESSDFFSSDFFYSDFFPSVWPFFSLPSVGLGLGVEGCYFSDSSNKFFKFYFLGLFSFFLLNINFSRLTLACD